MNEWPTKALHKQRTLEGPHFVYDRGSLLCRPCRPVADAEPLRREECPKGCISIQGVQL